MFRLTLLEEVHQLRLPLLSLLLFDMGHAQVLNVDMRDAIELRGDRLGGCVKDAALSLDFSDVRQGITCCLLLLINLSIHHLVASGLS